MDLTSYVDRLRQELTVVAETGGDDARALAGRLLLALDSATRLTLLDALSDAAAEITSDLAPGSVDMRLRGGEPSFVVTLPPSDQPADQRPVDAPPTQQTGADADDGPMVRINLRLPEQVKARVEEAAGRQGRSVNAWLVRAATSVLDAAADPGPSDGPSWGPQRFSGWVR